MKIISFSAIKGGVGKTTIAYNYGEWLADKGNKILFIDIDHQCNLTQIYDIYDIKDTIANAFTNLGDVKITNVKENIDIIAGYLELDKIETSLENKSNKDMLLYMWLEDNYEDKNIAKYDYIIIDCHPDFSVATRNAIAISHYILSPITPSEHGYKAKFNISERLKDFSNEVIDYRTRESYITSELMFLANMVRHNTNSSKQFKETIEDDNSIIGLIPEKELFNRSTLYNLSISEMAKDKSTKNQHRKFFDEIDETFETITKQLV